MTAHPATYSPSRAPLARLQRRWTQWHCASPLQGAIRRPIVSFTFDDFPRSAADTGAEILDGFGARGCFYAASGFAGRPSPSGDMFTADDLTALSQAGHEIGAHTHGHLDCARTGSEAALADIDRNLSTLQAMGAVTPIRQFAYPYGETDFRLKRALAGRFRAARGVLPGVVRPNADRMQLRAFEINGRDWTLRRALNAIEAAAHRPAWIILFTHDVRARPSEWGTTPGALRQLVATAHDAGAALLSPSTALAEIEGGTA